MSSPISSSSSQTISVTFSEQSVTSSCSSLISSNQVTTDSQANSPTSNHESRTPTNSQSQHQELYQNSEWTDEDFDTMHARLMQTKANIKELQDEIAKQEIALAEFKVTYALPLPKKK